MAALHEAVLPKRQQSVLYCMLAPVEPNDLALFGVVGDT
jgi:hypothetical protein